MKQYPVLIATWQMKEKENQGKASHRVAQMRAKLQSKMEKIKAKLANYQVIPPRLFEL